MRRSLPSSLVLLPLLLAACGGGKPDAAPAGGGTSTPAANELTPFQQEHGIGPVTEPVQLGAVDKEMAEAGEQLFNTKCSACHKMEERYVGPALGEVTTRRSPAYVMNMMLNPEEMYTRHPVARQLLAEHMTQMPNQGLTLDEARKILEYLRTEAPHDS